MTPYDADVWPIPVGSVSITGDVPSTSRFISGLYSLDHSLSDATGQIGVPLRGSLEIYGRWETGKSTLGYYLAGRVSDSGRIVLIDLEGGAREDYLKSAVAQAGFIGELHRVEFGKPDAPRSHEDMLKEGADAFLSDDVRCVLLDSAAMTQPLPEREGDIEEAFMGRRAQVLAKFIRRCNSWINSAKEDKLLIVINHMLQSMDGFGKMSPGGDTLKFGIHTRLWISRTQSKDQTLPYGAFTSDIEIEKLRFGGKNQDRKGRVAIIPTVGVSPELTAAFDAFAIKKARRQAGTGMVQYQKDGAWVDVALLKDLIKELLDGKRDSFDPFFEILKNHV